MLSKLIGYEFYATRRVYLAAFPAILILALLNAVLFGMAGSASGLSVTKGIIFAVYIFALFAIWVMALIYTIQRFYKNLLCDEGYLMFTLPAKPSQLIWAKAITSVIWISLTAVVCAVSLAIVMTPFAIVKISGGVIMVDGVSLASIVWQDYGAAMIIVPLELLVFFVLCILLFCMNLYMCLAIGNLFQRHRIAWAFGAYVVCGIIGQLVSIPFLNWLGSDATVYLKVVAELEDGVELYLVLLAMILAQVVFSAIYFAITNYILSKRLNLQ